MRKKKFAGKVHAAHINAGKRLPFLAVCAIIGGMMEPAKTIIEICGGVDAVAKICERDRSRVTRWGYPRSRGGTDGAIPLQSARALLQHAGDAGLPLTAAHFFVGLDQ